MASLNKKRWFDGDNVEAIITSLSSDYPTPPCRVTINKVVDEGEVVYVCVEKEIACSKS